MEALFRRMDENHMQMLMNCYEPVLTVALCRRLAGRGGRELTCDGSTTALLLGGRGRRGNRGTAAAPSGGHGRGAGLPAGA